MERRGSRFEQLVTSGGLEVVVAGAMAALSIVLGWVSTAPLGVLVDVVAYVTVIAMIRWPRTAGVALAALMTVFFLAPRAWVEFGEYAPLLAVIGLGLRGRRRLRLWLGAAYLALYIGLQIHDYGTTLTALLGAIVWTTLLALSSLLGTALHRYDLQQRELRQAALTEQRVQLARELHDTVARTLARVALRARQASADGDVSALDEIADGVSLAASELRWLLHVLREPDARLEAASGSIAEAVQRADERFRAEGRQFAATLEGDLSRVSEPVVSVVVLAIEEAVANLERHATAGSPSGMILSVGDDALDLVVMNQVDDSVLDDSTGLGLVGVRERLLAIDGELDAKREGTQWLMRLRAPLATGGSG